MAALSKSLIAEKIKLESQWNSQYLATGKETLEMKSIDARLKRIIAKLRWRNLENYDSPLFIPTQ